MRKTFTLLFLLTISYVTSISNLCNYIEEWEIPPRATSGWCEYTSPFSTVPRFLADFVLISNQNPKCKDDRCVGVTGVRPIDNYYVVAQVDGTVHRIGINQPTLLNDPIIDPKVDSVYENLLIESYVPDNTFVLLRNVSLNQIPTLELLYSRIRTNFTLTADNPKLEIMYRLWNNTIGASENILPLQLKVFKNNQEVVVALLYKDRVTGFTNLRFVTNGYYHEWVLKNGKGDFKIDIAQQHGNFSNTNINVKNANPKSTRTLIAIHDRAFVRIIGYNGNRKDQSPLVIDFSDTSSDVYFSSTFLHQKEENIEQCILVAEGTRRPESPSQNVQLLVVTLEDQDQMYKNFANLFHIPFIQYMDSSPPYGYDLNVTLGHNELLFVDDGRFEVPAVVNQRVSRNTQRFIASRFSDVPVIIDDQSTYDESGGLKPITICAVYKRSPSYNRDDYNKCLEKYSVLTNESQIVGFDDLYMDIFFDKYWKSQVFISNQMSIVKASIIPVLNSNLKVHLFYNGKTTTLPGDCTDMYVTPNSQFIYFAVDRSVSQMDSAKSYHELCDTLDRDSENKFLKYYQSLCDKRLNYEFNYEKLRYTDLNHFAYSISSCLYDEYCPSLTDTIVKTSSEDGKYLPRSNSIRECDIGYYCPQGKRFPCPPGYGCSANGLKAPTPCHVVLTSSRQYLHCHRFRQGENVQPCPFNAVCNNTFLMPTMAPRGYYVKFKELSFRPCELGDYCPFGVLEDEKQRLFKREKKQCPENTFCTNQTVIQPTQCQFNSSQINYCPKNSTLQSKCPAGYYCESLTEIYECKIGQYCPEGSYYFQICPSGYYCDVPSRKVLCPNNHYCPTGSSYPKPCLIGMNICSQGSRANQLALFGFLLLLLTLTGVLILFGIYKLLYWIYRSNTAAERLVEQQPLIIDGSKSTDNFTVDLRFEHLGLNLRSNGFRVLQDVNGEISHGQLTAVMGMSGAGKSTFITTLAGRAYYGNQVGDIYMNDQLTSLDKFNKRVGFVPQEEIMLRMMSVEETLLFSARTRLDSSTSKSHITTLVNKVITDLRLEKIRHSVIGDEETRGISGGERKRVNVAIEMVAEPYVLFLDEPTSGLDSASSKELCEALRSIANNGINVITVIHQPRVEIFNMFTHLLLLGYGGRTVYLGPVQEASKYFKSLGFPCEQHINPSDYLIDVTAGKIRSDLGIDPKTLPDIWPQHELNYKNPKAQETNRSVFKAPSQSPLIQFYMCMTRAFIQLMRNIKGLFIDCLLLIVAALLVGIMYQGREYEGPPNKSISDLCPSDLREVCSLPKNDPIGGQQAMVTLAIALIATMSALKTFGKEKVVFLRESETGLSTFCYFWAKDVAVLPTLFLAPLIFIIVFYSIVSPRAGSYEYYWIILLCYWCSYGLGYIVSIVVQPHVAQIAAVVFVFVIYVFSGSVILIPDIEKMFIPIRYVHYLSYLQYCYQALYIIEIRQFSDVYDLKRSLDIMGFKLENLGLCAGIIVAIGFVFRLVALILLVSTKPSSFGYKIVRWLTNYKQHLDFIKRLKPVKKNVSIQEGSYEEI
ncbi:hypothetical protein AKO1_008529 [Acrasis kona]|uniref:ABC transporter domain-containing protein n=1 Tax=Acrasis kona TaxID=1008807 RepID=A0AAW2YNT0_9EUKA